MGSSLNGLNIEINSLKIKRYLPYDDIKTDQTSASILGAGTSKLHFSLIECNDILYCYLTNQ